MNNKITKGQLITLWIFGILLFLWDLLYVMDAPSGFWLMLLLIIPGGLIFYTIWWRSKGERLAEELEVEKISDITDNYLEEVVINLASDIFATSMLSLKEITKKIPDIKDSEKLHSININVLSESIFFSIYRLNIFSRKFFNSAQKKVFNKQLLETFTFIMGKIYFTSRDETKPVPENIGQEFFDTFLPSRLIEYTSCKFEKEKVGMRFYGKVLNFFEDEGINIKENIINNYANSILQKCDEKNLIQLFK